MIYPQLLKENLMNIIFYLLQNNNQETRKLLIIFISGIATLGYIALISFLKNVLTFL